MVLSFSCKNILFGKFPIFKNTPECVSIFARPLNTHQLHEPASCGFFEEPHVLFPVFSSQFSQPCFEHARHCDEAAFLQRSFFTEQLMSAKRRRRSLPGTRETICCSRCLYFLSFLTSVVWRRDLPRLRPGAETHYHSTRGNLHPHIEGLVSAFDHC